MLLVRGRIHSQSPDIKMVFFFLLQDFFELLNVGVWKVHGETRHRDPSYDCFHTRCTSPGRELALAVLSKKKQRIFVILFLTQLRVSLYRLSLYAFFFKSVTLSYRYIACMVEVGNWLRASYPFGGSFHALNFCGSSYPRKFASHQFFFRLRLYQGKSFCKASFQVGMGLKKSAEARQRRKKSTADVFLHACVLSSVP